MSNNKVTGILLALVTSLATITPASAQYYVNPHGHHHGYAYGNVYGNPYGNPYGNLYGNPYHQPYYNDYNYRGYAPYDAYGYVPRYHRSHTVRNVAIGAGVGAGVGALVGLLASHHGHRYYE